MGFAAGEAARGDKWNWTLKRAAGKFLYSSTFSFNGLLTLRSKEYMMRAVRRPMNFTFEF
jgi:hypothetical protein